MRSEPLETNVRQMLRALGDLAEVGSPAPLVDLAKHMEMSEDDAREALNALQKENRLARRRMRGKVECWEPWSR
jgi:DNA-binding IclR family transcriptional regulator